MFGFNLFGDTIEYIVEIYEGNQCTQRNKMAMPEQMAQGQFMSLCQQAKQSGRPMKVKISKYEWIEGRETPLETSIEYQTWSD